MSFVQGAVVRGVKTPDQAWCDECLVDIDLDLDDVEDHGEAGHVCGACADRLNPDLPEEPLSPEMEAEAEELFGPDEDTREEFLEQQHLDELVRERGRQP